MMAAQNFNLNYPSTSIDKVCQSCLVQQVRNPKIPVFPSKIKIPYEI